MHLFVESILFICEPVWRSSI